MTVCQTRVQRERRSGVSVLPHLTVSSDGHTELAGSTLRLPPTRQLKAAYPEWSCDAGPTKVTTIDNAPEEWRVQFTNLLSPRVGRNPGGFTASIAFQGPIDSRTGRASPVRNVGDAQAVEPPSAP